MEREGEAAGGRVAERLILCLYVVSVLIITRYTSGNSIETNDDEQDEQQRRRMTRNDDERR